MRAYALYQGEEPLSEVEPFSTKAAADKALQTFQQELGLELRVQLVHLDMRHRRGGFREGAGRKPSGKRTYNVRLEPEVARLLKAYGNGSISAGILRAACNIKVG